MFALDALMNPISTRAPTGGATRRMRSSGPPWWYFYSRPHGRGDAHQLGFFFIAFFDFYSRPHGRGDVGHKYTHITLAVFLLAPPREGRPGR